MEIIRIEKSYKLNKGNLQADGLYNVSSKNNGLSFWFYEDYKDKLLKLEGNEFIFKCDKIIDWQDVLNEKLSFKNWIYEQDKNIYLGYKTIDFKTQYCCITIEVHPTKKLFTYCNIYNNENNEKINNLYFSADNIDEMIDLLISNSY